MPFEKVLRGLRGDRAADLLHLLDSVEARALDANPNDAWTIGVREKSHTPGSQLNRSQTCANPL